MSRRAAFSASFSWRRRAVERRRPRACGSWSRSGSRGSPSCSGRASRRRRAAAARLAAPRRRGRSRRRRGRRAVAAVALDVARARPPSRPGRRCPEPLTCVEVDAVRGRDAPRDRRAGRRRRGAAASPSRPSRRRPRRPARRRSLRLGAATVRRLLLRARRRRRPAPRPASSSASAWPTSTVSSSWARIFTSLPAAGAGTSASTLSVETSTIGLVLVDPVALLLVPGEDGALGHRLTHLRAS